MEPPNLEPRFSESLQGPEEGRLWHWLARHDYRRRLDLASRFMEQDVGLRVPDHELLRVIREVVEEESRPVRIRLPAAECAPSCSRPTSSGMTSLTGCLHFLPKGG